MEEIVNTFALRRKDGAYMNYFFERAKNIRSAARFNDLDHFNDWINGHYKPDHPEDFEIVPLEITYKVVEP